MSSNDPSPVSPDDFDFETSEPAPKPAAVAQEAPIAQAPVLPTRAVGLIEATASGVQRLQTLLEPPKTGESKIDKLVEILEAIVARQDQLAARLEAIDAKLTAPTQTQDAVH